MPARMSDEDLAQHRFGRLLSIQTAIDIAENPDLEDALLGAHAEATEMHQTIGGPGYDGLRLGLVDLTWFAATSLGTGHFSRRVGVAGWAEIGRVLGTMAADLRPWHPGGAAVLLALAESAKHAEFVRAMQYPQGPQPTQHAIMLACVAVLRHTMASRRCDTDPKARWSYLAELITLAVFDVR